LNIEQSLGEEPVLEPQGHSRMGIAALAISLGTGLAYLLLIVVLIVTLGGMVSTTQDPNVIVREIQSGNQSGLMVAVVVFGLCMFSSPVLSLVGLGLGIAGVFQKDKRKIFPVLGIVFSSLLLCGSGSVVLLGLMSAFTG
jgi:hypothetical protein